MSTEMMRPIPLYFPITRRDDAKREVEGYCFVNEIVQGEGGIRLKRSAMMDAADGYLQFPTIREMHRKDNAAGLTTSLKFDGAGALITCKVVDDAAWAKVQAGVYRGFSVGVLPTRVRGKDIEAVDWVEISLVDRPADPGARISVFRNTEFDMQHAYPVERIDKPKKGNKESRSMSAAETPTAAAAAAEPIDTGNIERLLAENTEHTATITRLQSDVTDRDAQIAVLRQAETKSIKRLKKANKSLERLGKQPVPTVAPVIFPSAVGGLERTFEANTRADIDGSAPDPAVFRDRYTAITKSAEGEIDQTKKNNLALEMSILKSQAALCGIDLQ